jgi:hypothetical protein
LYPRYLSVDHGHNDVFRVHTGQRDVSSYCLAFHSTNTNWDANDNLQITILVGNVGFFVILIKVKINDCFFVRFDNFLIHRIRFNRLFICLGCFSDHPTYFTLIFLVVLRTITPIP